MSPEARTPGECSEVVAHLMASTRLDYVSVSQSNYASIDHMIPDMSYPRAPFLVDELFTLVTDLRQSHDLVRSYLGT